MPTAQYTALANVTLASAAATVTFSSISQSYKDLFLVIQATFSSAPNDVLMIFNGDSSSSYPVVEVRGESTVGTSAFSRNGIFIMYASNTTQVQVRCNIMDYAATNKHKSVLTRFEKPDVQTNMSASRWPSTSAITSLVLDCQTSDWAAGSTFALYGVK